MFGNIVIASSGFFKDMKFIKKGEKQDTLKNMDHNFVEIEEDFNIVKSNLSSIVVLFDGDSKKAAEELKITKLQLENILNYGF